MTLLSVHQQWFHMVLSKITISKAPAISMDFKVNKNPPELPPPHFDFFSDIAADHFG